jgi:hypothetical protein
MPASYLPRPCVRCSGLFGRDALHRGVCPDCAADDTQPAAGFPSRGGRAERPTPPAAAHAGGEHPGSPPAPIKRKRRGGWLRGALRCREAGLTIKETAGRVGVAERTLRELGKFAPGQAGGRRVPLSVEELRPLIAAGLNSAQIAKRLGGDRTPNGVRQAARRLGLRLGGSPGLQPLPDADDIRRLTDDGETLEGIATRLDVSRKSVQRVARGAGIRLRRASRPQATTPEPPRPVYGGPIHEAVVTTGFCRRRGWSDPRSEAEARLAVAVACGSDRGLGDARAVARVVRGMG